MKFYIVLILIVLEVGLGPKTTAVTSAISDGLNPYCIGSRSWTYITPQEVRQLREVLILIVLEVGLGQAGGERIPAACSRS